MMKLAKLMMTTTACLVATFATAGTLKTPNSVEMLALDGQSVKRWENVQINDTKTHQVVVSVGDIVDGKYFSMNPIVLTFEGTNEEMTLVVPQFRSSHDVNKFQANPTFKIQTASGKEIPFKQDVLKGEGFAPNSRIEDNLVKYTASKGVAAVPAFVNATFEAKGQIVVETKNVKEEQLQLLFSKADKETQQRFLEWAKKNVK